MINLFAPHRYCRSCITNIKTVGSGLSKCCFTPIRALRDDCRLPLTWLSAEFCGCLEHQYCLVSQSCRTVSPGSSALPDGCPNSIPISSQALVSCLWESSGGTNCSFSRCVPFCDAFKATFLLMYTCKNGTCLFASPPLWKSLNITVASDEQVAFQ